MITRLFVLNGSGDMKLTWNHDNPDECENARKTVAELRDQGYVFFLVDGSVADEVTAGGGMLVVRKLKADEVMTTEAAATEPATEATPSDPEPAPKRRGRPPKVQPAPDGPSVVAVRPVRGG